MKRFDPSSLRPSIKLPGTDMSRSDFEPRPPASRAGIIPKSYLDS